jgi:hypothetical protein
MGMKITIGQLRSIIRETLEGLQEIGDLQRPASLGHGRSPDWGKILRKFEELRNENGEVLENVLASALGKSPRDLDYNGTGLRVVDGVVSEMLYDTPYR